MRLLLAAGAMMAAMGTQGDAAAQQSGLPRLQPGLWAISGDENRQMCGDPLARIAKDIAEMGEVRKFGCTVQTSSNGPRTYTFVTDCPTSVPGGVPAGRGTITVSSPTPQSFTLDLQHPQGMRASIRGERKGDC